MLKNNNNDLNKIIKELETNPYEYANSISVEKLENILRQLSQYYYNTDESLVSDYIFDILKDVLEEKNPNNPFLFEVGAPISKDKVNLPYPMASLNKIKPGTQALVEYTKKHRGPYVWSDKLDGVSGLLYKTNNKFKLYTRGNGIVGQDITHLIPYILKGKYKPSKIPNNTAIRGEIIISKANFETIKDKFQNARNTVAGLVNSKTVPVDIAKLTDFIGYSVVHPQYTQEIQMKKLEEWEFPIVEYKITHNLMEKELSDYLQERRKNGKYEVDGVVVIDSSKAYDVLNANPTYGFAFKMVLADQVVEVKVLDIVWSITMHGYLKPVVKIKPVSLVGVEISNVTAFNAKYVVDNNLGPGSVIRLVRSGDVIPHILAVLSPSSSGLPKMPDVPHKWNESGVDLLVKDIHGAAKDSITVKQLTHFFKTLGVKYISDGILTKLVEHGYKTVPDILNANINKLSKIEGIGGKLITKIFENTRVAFETTNLETLMAASNVFGRGFGVRKNKVITDAYPNIMNEDWNEKQLYEKLIPLEGFDVKTAKQFSSNFTKFKQFFHSLENIKLISVKQLKQPPKKTTISQTLLFKDMKIVFTGFRDGELEKFIVGNGGQLSTTVSKNTDLIVYKDGDNSSAKYLKAKELGIDMITVEYFKKKYKFV